MRWIKLSAIVSLWLFFFGVLAIVSCHDFAVTEQHETLAVFKDGKALIVIDEKKFSALSVVGEREDRAG